LNVGKVVMEVMESSVAASSFRRHGRH
jgi:hypothetical protein